MPAPRKTGSLLAAVMMLVLTGLLAGAWAARQAQRTWIADLLEEARRTAAAFDSAELRRLAGTLEDRQVPAYLAVKDRLLRANAVRQDVEAVRLVRYFPESDHARVLADSTPADAASAAQPGDPWDLPATGSGVRAAARSSDAAYEEPVGEGAGERVRAYALVFDHSVMPGAGPRDVLSLDVPAILGRRARFEAGVAAALSTWLVLALGVGLFLALRRRGTLDRQVRQLAAAFDRSHSAAMIVGLDDRIEYVNASLCRQGGYTREELIGRDWRRLKSLDAPEPPFEEMVQCVYSGHSWVGHWSNGRKDGSSYPVRGILSPVEGVRGRPVGFIAVFDDMTSVRQREAELREAKDRARAGEQAKGRFLATMSHEVRTPLNGIVGFTSLLLDTPLTPEQRDYVQTIRTSSEALIRLTTEILDYARIDAGRLELDPQPCDPRVLLEEVMEIFASAAAEKNLALLHRVWPEVPATVRIDSGRLRQVLVNLIGNAVKFTPAGEVEVTVRRVNDQLAFAVRDTGPGVAAADAEAIFRPFGQLDSSLTRRFGGVGLGLSISRSLAIALGGGIDLASEPGRGATFTLTVRCEELAVAPAAARSLLGCRVALVGDGKALREELAWVVRGYGAEPHPCRFDELAATTWDVALADVDAAVLAQIRAHPVPAGAWGGRAVFGLVPITLPAEVRRVVRAQFRELFNKPPRHRVVCEALVRALRPESEAPVAAGHPVFGLRVLIVEDNRVNQALLQRILEALGCEWIAVPDGRRAIEELSLHAYDVVLMDLHMPEVDGVEAARLIRAGEAGTVAREAWIAVVSADIRPEQRERAFAAGANDYLQKPVTLADIEEALRRYLVERRQLTR